MLLLNKNLLRLSKGVRGHILLIAALKLLVLVGVAHFTQTIAGFLGSLYTGVTVGSFREALLNAGSATLAILLGNLLVGEAEFRCTERSRTLLRKGLYSKLLQLDVANIDSVGTAGATTCVVDGVENMQIYYSQYLPSLLYYFTAPFYIFLKIRNYSMPVAVFLLLVCIFILPINNLFRSRIEQRKSGYWKSLSELTAHYLESLQGLTTLKLYNRDSQRNRELKARADDFNHRIMDVMKLNFLATMTTNALMYFSIFIAIVMLCVSGKDGSIALRQALTVLMLSYSFYSSVRMLMDATHRALNGIAAARTIEDILTLQTEKPLLPRPEQQETEQGLRLSHVNFSYPGRELCLKDMDLWAEKGKVTAIVGPSGCGKSTVLSHLLRFRDPDSGRVLLDGLDLRCLTAEEVREHVVMVPQSIFIFSGTLASNLRLADPEATDEELERVLEIVHLGKWLRSLPDGLNTDVGDAGAKLSGGQKQKLGIARVLLTKAEYVIFDEATSSVDRDSEEDIWNCLRSMAHTRTLIIVSHRLSAIAWADRIYCLENGRTEGCGTHEELMAQHGLYYKLTQEQQLLEQRLQKENDHESKE